MSTALFCHLCELFVVSTIVIGGILLLSPLLTRRYGVKWRKYVWVLLGVLMLFPFRLSDMIPAIHVPGITVTLPEQDWAQICRIILCIWLAGALVAFRIKRIRLRHTEAEIMETCEEADSAVVLDTLERVRKQVGIDEEITVCFSDKIQEPMVIGVVVPYVILPEAMQNQDNTQKQTKSLEQVLRDELEHLKALDGWYRGFMQFISSLYWFHPLVYVMTWVSAKDLNRTIDNKTRKKGYALIPVFVLIFLLLRSSFTLAAGNVVSKNNRDSNESVYGSQSEENRNDSDEDDKDDEDKEEKDQEEAKAEHDYVKEGVHPDTGLTPDKEQIKSVQKNLYEGLTEQQITEVKKIIRTQHHGIESNLVFYGISYSGPDYAAWKRYDPEVDASNSTVNPSRSGYDDIKDLERAKEILDKPIFTKNVDEAITEMKHAIETHDEQDLYHYHQILHDLDYWLISYPIGNFTVAPPDWHGVYVYFDILSYE